MSRCLPLIARWQFFWDLLNSVSHQEDTPYYFTRNHSRLRRRPQARTAIADEQPGDNMLLTWYDRERDIESPAHVSECREGCAIKGFWEYALNRGGKLAVDFDEERFVFCFMPLGDFAPPQ